jgi:exonuclease V
MASPAIPPTSIEIILDDAESDYGSDFSPEEELIVVQLLSQNAVEDNPIVNDVEFHEKENTLRIPHAVVVTEQPGVLLRAARAAEKVSEQINEAVGGDARYPDCKIVLCLETVWYLTDAEALSEQSNHRRTAI